MLRQTVIAAHVLTASAAQALVEVGFNDGRWDVFTISATGCPIAEAVIVIDLVPSVAGVIIDTTYGGPGFQDPLPAQLVSGNATLAPVADGAQQLTVAVSLLDEASPIVLQMDVDDTIGTMNGSRISVARSEIAGAEVRVTVGGATSTGIFDDIGIARLTAPDTVPDCNALS